MATCFPFLAKKKNTKEAHKSRSSRHGSQSGSRIVGQGNRGNRKFQVFNDPYGIRIVEDGNIDHPIHVKGSAAVYIGVDGNLVVCPIGNSHQHFIPATANFQVYFPQKEPVIINGPVCVEDHEVKVVPTISVDSFEQPQLDLQCDTISSDNHERLNIPIVIREVGECSKAPQQVPDAKCNMCMEPKFMYDCFSPKNCSHLYCASCIERYVETKVKQNVTSISCPEQDCQDGYVEREMCRYLLKPKVFNQWGIALGNEISAAPIEPDAYCNICMELKFKHECFSMKNCSHLYCSCCVGEYIKAKVEENVTSIGCPDPDCKDGYLEPEMCRNILLPEVFNRWGVALCVAMIGSMKLYCPYKDCSALLIDERAVSKDEVITSAKCPHCLRLFCAECMVEWHAGVTCKEFQVLGDGERGRDDIMLMQMAQNSKWQRCPKCKFYVERSYGCSYMKCRCGYSFCYGCGSKLTVHFCTKCMR